jgi:acetylornithine aminotransferase/acetylornithine/N-succinyldiaminopimelate aminotransferase
VKDIVPPPPPIIENELRSIQGLFEKHVLPTYARFDLAFTRGTGSYLWDVHGRKYLDFGGGIAVCCLGHAHPAITAALAEQSQCLLHVSNLYFHAPQGRLAQALTSRIAPGRVFFCNSGAEANEGLFKLARRFGHEQGRFEILTAWNSFHGRTLAGIAATGQDKVKKGFEPMVAGFRHIPFNDLDAARQAISPATVAVLIEGIQGEGGIRAATPEYLLGLRQLCDKQRLLLLMDGVQCGHFRTGRFQSFQRLLEGFPGGAAFLPDAISMAKSLGGGFPMGAFWVREALADLLGPGTHATTFGGTPLGCAVALRILDVIQTEGLADHARSLGDFMLERLRTLATVYPHLIQSVRGVGLMIGVELGDKDQVPAWRRSDKAPSLQMVHRLHEAGLLSIPSGAQVLRFLPALNLSRSEAAEGLDILESVLRPLA